MVVNDRCCVFGEIREGAVRLNDAGQMAEAAWRSLEARFCGVHLDVFIVMPNHIHGVVWLTGLVGAPLVGARDDDLAPATTGATTRVAPTTLGAVVGAYKSLTTVEYGRGVRRCGWPPFCRTFWQRNYYEHIIRDEQELDRTRQYILDNPARWDEDANNPRIEEAPSGR